MGGGGGVLEYSEHATAQQPTEGGCSYRDEALPYYKLLFVLQQCLTAWCQPNSTELKATKRAL